MPKKRWSADILYMTEEMLVKEEKLEDRRKYFVILGVFLVVFWILHDFVLSGNREFRKIDEYTFEDKSVREVARSMDRESRRLVSVGNEKEQIIGFVHILERNHYLLHQNEISLESYYDFLNTILYPKQKRSLKVKAEYAYQVDKYLKRMRKTKYEYMKYELAEPEFYYEDYTRNARVLLVRTSVEGNRESLKHYFRKFKDRYYLYLK